MSVNGPISPKQCYYEMDYSFYSFYWLDSLEIRLDHNSTYYRSLSKNSDVKPRISHCDLQNLQYKTHPEFWPSHRRIFKTSLYYKTRLILETRRYFVNFPQIIHSRRAIDDLRGHIICFLSIPNIIFDTVVLRTMSCHHSDVTSVKAYHFSSHLIVCSKAYQANDKETTKALNCWALCTENPGGFPAKKSQQCGKCIRIMQS